MKTFALLLTLALVILAVRFAWQASEGEETVTRVMACLFAGALAFQVGGNLIFAILGDKNTGGYEREDGPDPCDVDRFCSP
jgi:hypothetical protein